MYWSDRVRSRYIKFDKIHTAKFYSCGGFENAINVLQTLSLKLFYLIILSKPTKKKKEAFKGSA